MAYDQVDNVLAEARQSLMKFIGVRTVGKGFIWKNGKMTKQIGIVVGVTNKLAPKDIHPKQFLPESISGIEIDVVDSHEIMALAAPIDYDCQQYRPVIGGCGLGHYLITGGTLGEYRSDWDLEISNNHVLANQNQASIGDPIMQPAPICSSQQNQVATLAGFKKIEFTGSSPTCPISQTINAFYALLGRKSRLTMQAGVNHVDVAFAKPTVEHVTGFIDIGVAVGHKDAAELGSEGTGRGARQVKGVYVYNDICTQVNVSVQVGYSNNNVAVFEDQTIHQTADGLAPIAPGSSGTTRRDKQDGKIDGLYFAGSDTMGIASPYHYVIEAHDELGI